MPIYTYHCDEHGEQEHVAKYEDRDSMVCRVCLGPLVRAPAERPGLLKPDGEPGMGIYLQNRKGAQSETIRGHFGKEAPKQRPLKRG